MSDKKPNPSARPQGRRPTAGDKAKTPQNEALEPVDDGTENHDGGEQSAGWEAGQEVEAFAVIEALQAENAEIKDRLLRAMAEMENLRRRTEREKGETAKYAISNFARDVLSVSDNIARAIDAVPQNEVGREPALKALLEGVQMTERELMQTLERHGIAKIEAEGQRFDPNRHQAVFEVENKDVPEGTVVEVMQAGHMIEDRILRPAMVAVSKGGAKQPKAANDDGPEQAPGQSQAKDAGPGGDDVGAQIDKNA